MDHGRRTFLKRYASLFPLLAASNGFAGTAWAQAGAKNQSRSRLLLVVLRGGFDADSLLFQAENGFYHDMRPTISIGRHAGSQVLLPVKGPWFMHPAWSDLSELIESREMAFVPFCGSGDNSRSHFKAQDVLERGLRPDGVTPFEDGIANRMLQKMMEPHKATIGGFYTSEKPPVAATGPVPFAGMGKLFRSQDAEPLEEETLRALRRLYKDPENASKLMLAQNVREQAQETLQTHAAMMMQHGADSRPARGVIEQFRQLGVLMQRGGPFSVAVTDINGWDTHAGQGNENGNLSNRFKQLAQALMTFRESIGTLWKSTSVVVVSEFGRTFRENGTRGTDHGHGSTMVLLSGTPFEAAVLGKYHVITKDSLHEGRDQPVVNEYQMMMARYVVPKIST